MGVCLCVGVYLCMGGVCLDIGVCIVWMCAFVGESVYVYGQGSV
jgi:hypothetical protein